MFLEGGCERGYVLIYRMFQRIYCDVSCFRLHEWGYARKDVQKGVTVHSWWL